MKWAIIILTVLFLIVAYNTKAEDERWAGNAIGMGGRFATISDHGIRHNAPAVGFVHYASHPRRLPADD